MLDEARSESDRIIRGAQDEAEKITSEEEVLKRAEKRSSEIMEDARRRSARSGSAPRITLTRCSPTSRTTSASSSKRSSADATSCKASRKSNR